MTALRLLPALLLAALAGCGVPAPAPDGTPPTDVPLVIEGATLIDGTGAPPVPDAVVVVRGGRIARVGRRGEVRPPPGARVLDARGRYLIPGLIDMHAHAMAVRCDGTFDRGVSERMLGVLLRFGITTVRSPATPTGPGMAIREDVAAGRVPGPRIFASAEFINGRGRTPEQVRDTVRAQAAHRPDFVKLYAGLSPEAVRAGIEEAHAHGIPVIGHLQRTTWLDAARMGIDHVTHGASWSAEDLPAEHRAAYAEAAARPGMRARILWLERLDVHAPRIDTTIAEIARRRISLDPTLVAYDAKFRSPSDPRYRRNPNRAVVPELLADWEACGSPTDDWSAEDHARMAAAWPRMLALTRRLYEGGVLLTAGSDVTNAWVIPGESLHQELELLVEAGIPPLQVLRIATGNGAEALGILADAGTVEPGKRADLVLLAADPLADVRNTRSIRAVMQGGRWTTAPPGPPSAAAPPRPAAWRR